MQKIITLFKADLIAQLALMQKTIKVKTSEQFF